MLKFPVFKNTFIINIPSLQNSLFVKIPSFTHSLLKIHYYYNVLLKKKSSLPKLPLYKNTLTINILSLQNSLITEILLTKQPPSVGILYNIKWVVMVMMAIVPTSWSSPVWGRWHRTCRRWPHHLYQAEARPGPAVWEKCASRSCGSQNGVASCSHQCCLVGCWIIHYLIHK